MKKSFSILFVFFLLNLSCSSTQDISNNSSNNQTQNYKLLSLGDSYTIGQSVCETCRFPEQLKDSLSRRLPMAQTFDLNVIATTGWTTTNLIAAIAEENPSNDYDLVTLLIGVNNQYQGKPFSLYEEEFPQLVSLATSFGGGDKSNVIVVSIPDYAYTPFGQGNSNPQIISDEIDAYNTFAQQYCEQNEITFINITDITRNGLTNPELVASDGLHPSEIAYSKFVERLIPQALQKLQ